MNFAWKISLICHSRLPGCVAIQNGALFIGTDICISILQAASLELLCHSMQAFISQITIMTQPLREYDISYQSV
jgi:hypothetical protein